MVHNCDFVRLATLALCLCPGIQYYSVQVDNHATLLIVEGHAWRGGGRAGCLSQHTPARVRHSATDASVTRKKRERGHLSVCVHVMY